MNASSGARKSRSRWVVALRIIGWMTVSAALLVCALCAVLFFSRSPGDFEGMGQMAAVHIALACGLPLLVVGSMILWFADRERRATPPDTPFEPKITP